VAEDVPANRALLTFDSGYALCDTECSTELVNVFSKNQFVAQWAAFQQALG